MTDFSYDAWPSGEPYDWGNAKRGEKKWDAPDFHVDLGCGKLKKGRIGIDLRPAPGVNVVMDLNDLRLYALAPEPGRDAVEVMSNGDQRLFTGGLLPTKWPQGHADYGPGGEFYDLNHGWGRLPFGDSSIKSIISHHCLEHVGDGFLRLIDEVYRVLEPGGLFRAITPLFPSRTAVEDPDHRRYFMEGTWDSFCGTPGDTPDNCWQSSFSVPYTSARFKLLDKDITAPVPFHLAWGEEDVREIRVALEAMK